MHKESQMSSKAADQAGGAVTSVALAAIKVEPDFQVRVELDQGIVAEYAERRRAGDVFPPIDAFLLEEQLVLVDGLLRYKGEKENGAQSIAVRVHEGTRPDALRYALGANTSHGLPLTAEDKRRAVGLALENFRQMSDRAIADMVKVSPTFVGRVRGQRPSTVDSSIRLGRDGKRRALPRRQPRGSASRQPDSQPRPPQPAALEQTETGRESPAPEQLSRVWQRLEKLLDDQVGKLPPGQMAAMAAHLEAYAARLKSMVPAAGQADQPPPPTASQAPNPEPQETAGATAPAGQAPAPTLSILGAAQKILSEAEGPLTPAEVWDRVSSRQLVRLSAKRPLDSLRSKMYIAAKQGTLGRTGSRFFIPGSGPKAKHQEHEGTESIGDAKASTA
jgi:hypothetical protein